MLALALLVLPANSADIIIDTHAFLLKWPSQVSAHAGVFGFSLSVQEDATESADVGPRQTSGAYETGLVWRENTTVRGVAACCGNASWALRPGTTYSWRVQEYEGQPAVSVGRPLTGRFVTSFELPTPRDEALRETFSPATTRVFNDTSSSLAGRTKINGFFGESPFAGEYGSAEFTRTVGAAVAAFLEMGDDEHARRILRLILDIHKAHRAPFPSHTIGCTPLNTSDISRCALGMIEQTDGSFHLVLAWARWCSLHPEDNALFQDFYEMMARWTKRYLVPFPAPGTRGAQCYDGAHFAPNAPRNVSGWLAGYAPGVGDGPLPYRNTLADAIAYCCRENVAPGCGGVTLATNTNWSYGRYEARTATGLTPGAGQRSWLKHAGRDATPFFNTTLNLIYNPALEHSRDYHYWSDYDLISNVFAEEALRMMGYAAVRANDTESAAAFRAFRTRLQTGINTSLSHVVGDGGADNVNTPIYAELRPRGPGGISPSTEFVWGMSWVNLSPVPAYQIALSTRLDSTVPTTGTALDPERMDATVLAYRRQGFFVWDKLKGTHECAPDNNSASSCRVASSVVGTELALTHVNSSTHGVPFVKNQKAPNGNPLFGGVQVDEAVIGKGFGWELAWAAHRGDWQRVVAMQRWVGQWTNGFRLSKNLPSVPFVGKHYFAEVYTYSEYRDRRPVLGEPDWPIAGSSGSYENDPGNGEQACWFVWGSAVVRNLLGGSA
eukprot:COSAG02_NODE_1708_length_11229_cov_14.784097_1_plen_723_part_00